MTTFIRGVECERCRIQRVVLNSNAAETGSTAQKGVITTPVWDSVISLNVHQVIVPIVGTNDFARLVLTVGGRSLNGFDDGRFGAYAVGVPLTRRYVGDTVGIYQWPSDMFPVYEARKPYPPLGGRWQYEWTRNDGTNYPVTDPWVAEFFVVLKCHDHVDQF